MRRGTERNVFGFPAVSKDAKARAGESEADVAEALFAAAKRGNLGQLRQILKGRHHLVDVPSQAARGMTALAVVCMHGNVETAKLLLACGADKWNVHKVGTGGGTPASLDGQEYCESPSQLGLGLTVSALHVAAAFARADMVEYLVRKEGMDINMRLEGSGETPLQLLLARREMSPDGMTNWWEAVRTMRRLGADVHLRDARGACGICVLVSVGRSDLLPALFSEQGAGFDPQELARRVNVGDVVSSFLARDQQEEGIEEAHKLQYILDFLRDCMEEEAHVEGRDVNFQTLLDVPKTAFCDVPLLAFATLQNKPSAVKVLLQAGALPNVARGTSNWPPLLAAQCGDLRSLIHYLSHPDFSFKHQEEEEGGLEREVVFTLLEEAAARQSQGRNPLPLPDLAHFLGLALAGGLSVTKPDRNGRSLMCAAATLGHVDLLRMLFKAGGRKTRYLNAREKGPLFFNTPLEAAVLARRHSVVKWLLAHGADVCRLDSQSRHVLWYIQPEDAVRASGGGEGGGNAMLDVLMAHVQGSLQSQDLQQWLDHRDSGGTTPTQYIMRYLDPVCLQRMVRAGARVNAPDSQGVPALYAACRDKQVGLVSVLSAAPGFREAVQWRGPRHGITALGLAVSYGYTAILSLLLKACQEHNIEVAPLLEVRPERSKLASELRNGMEEGPEMRLHLPLFAALINRKPEAFAETFASNSAALASQLEVWQVVPGIPLEQARVAEEGEEGEHMTLPMCAAAVGDCSSLRRLIAAGAPLAPQGTANRYLRDAMTLAVDYPDLLLSVKAGTAHSPTSPLSPRFNSMATTSSASPLGSEARGRGTAGSGVGSPPAPDSPRSPCGGSPAALRGAERGVWDSAERTAAPSRPKISTEGDGEGGSAPAGPRAGASKGSGVLLPACLEFGEPNSNHSLDMGAEDALFPSRQPPDGDALRELERAVEQYASSECGTPTGSVSAGGRSFDSLVDIVGLDETSMELDATAFSRTLAHWEARRAALKPLERRTQAEAAHMLRLLHTRQSQIEAGWKEWCEGEGLDPRTGRAAGESPPAAPSGPPESPWAPAHAAEVRWCATRLQAISESLEVLREVRRSGDGAGPAGDPVPRMDPRDLSEYPGRQDPISRFSSGPPRDLEETGGGSGLWEAVGKSEAVQARPLPLLASREVLQEVGGGDPGTCQLREEHLQCASILLDAGCGMSPMQKAKLELAVAQRPESKAGARLAEKLIRQAGQCAVCSMWGIWPRCGRCHSVFYCGPAHQSQDWPRHQAQCEPLCPC
eukprot:jgi/Botrbrau1/19539/Bobra.0035s0033.1